MRPQVVNRSDLAWALTAVLPHVGSAAKNLDFVGFAGPYLFATDGYTVGIAEVALRSDAGAEEVPFYLTPSEAKDLLRFVRPSRKAEHLQDVQLLTHIFDDCDDISCYGACESSCRELHVSVGPEGPFMGAGDQTEPLSEPGGITTPATDSDASMLKESEVYDLRLPGTPFPAVYGLVDTVYNHLDGGGGQFTVNPDFTARFAKAGRDSDQMHLHTARASRFQAAVVTVGQYFLGCVMGIDTNYPQESTLPRWGLTQNREAA